MVNCPISVYWAGKSEFYIIFHEMVNFSLYDIYLICLRLKDREVDL